VEEMKSLSKIIKSSLVKIGDEKLTIPASITIPAQEYLHIQSFHHSNDESHYQKHEDPNALQQVNLQIEEMIKNAQDQAHLILEEAQQSARAIENDAMDQSKIIYDSAYIKAQEEGYQQGFNEGYEEARNSIEEALAIKKEWLAHKENLVKDIEKEAIALVIQSLEKILGEMITSSDYVVHLINQGMKNIAYTEKITVRVCEADYNYALSLRDKILAMAQNIDELEIKLDYALKPGQVFLDTQSGNIDASIESQFHQIKELFEALLVGE